MGQSEYEAAALFRYPVKSLQGELVEHLVFDNDHSIGDRDWAIVDPAEGKVLSAKRWGALLEASARCEPDGTVVLTLPDGAEHLAGDPATDDAVSSWLDRPVELRRAGSASLPYELLTDAIDDASPTFTFAGPDSHWGDLAAAHLLTTASLRAAALLHPDGDWDVRRFRPTVLIDGPAGDTFVEDGWVGSVAGIGASARFDIFMPTVRCSLPVRAQPGGLHRDPAVSRVLQEHHNLSLGVYASIRAGGTIAVADPVLIGAP
jgi:uncharacterized protein YcbX